MQTLRDMRAIGAARAVTQAALASACGISPRKLQEVTLELNRRGVAVLSSCVAPFGVYLAETDDEIRAYDHQLRGRLIGNAMRRGYVRKILRDRACARAVEPDGQRRLFA